MLGAESRPAAWLSWCQPSLGDQDEDLMEATRSCPSLAALVKAAATVKLNAVFTANCPTVELRRSSSAGPGASMHPSPAHRAASRAATPGGPPRKAAHPFPSPRVIPGSLVCLVHR